MPDRMPDKMLEDMPDRMPEGMPERTPECLPDRMPEDLPDNMPEDMPDRMPEDMPDKMLEDMPDRMPEGMPERTPECLPDRMPEDLPGRMPEDLPVTKCINVMVGITRSKVIYCSFFTCKCPSRHNSMHFFDMATSKSGPKLRCFVHFDLEMCFAPQRRALFRHLNFQKWSEPLVFLTF